MYKQIEAFLLSIIQFAGSETDKRCRSTRPHQHVMRQQGENLVTFDAPNTHYARYEPVESPSSSQEGTVITASSGNKEVTITVVAVSTASASRMLVRILNPTPFICLASSEKVL